MRQREVKDAAEYIPPGIRHPLKISPADRLQPEQRSKVLEARRKRVADLMCNGYTEADIAEELDISPSLAHYDIEHIRQMWREQTVENVERAAILDLARLDKIINRLSPAVDAGDYKAADTCLRAILARATILGYRNGASSDVESYIRKMAEQNGYDPEVAVTLAQKISFTIK